MFTGIVTDMGEVRSVEKRGDTRVVIGTSYDTGTIDIGASIACSGVCLTVVDKGDDWFSVDVSGETLSRTALGDWQPGAPVNLERSLKVGDELGGHIVTGHVDGLAEIVEKRRDGDSFRFRFRAGRGLSKYLTEKGSVTLNGVSLTVNEVEDSPDDTLFGINIIPHTQDHTTFGAAEAGQKVNVEVDVLARYVARLEERA